MPQAPAETEQVCPRGSKSISGFPLGLGSVTPEVGVQGSPEGASSQGKRLRPTAVTEVAGGRGRGGRVPCPSADPPSAPPAPHSLANFLRLPPARVYTCSWFCGACPRPHLPPGRWLSHSPSLQSHSPRVRRTINPSLRDQYHDLGISGGGTAQPAPLLSFTPLRQPPQVTGHVSAKGAASTSPRRHRSSWGRVHTAQGARDPPERGPARRPPRKTAAQRKR